MNDDYLMDPAWVEAALDHYATRSWDHLVKGNDDIVTLIERAAMAEAGETTHERNPMILLALLVGTLIGIFVTTTILLLLDFGNRP